jgi:hypothetical protein
LDWTFAFGVRAKQGSECQIRSTSFRNLYGLHKVFPPRFQVDAAPLEAHAFDVERKNCDSRSYFQERPTRDNSIAIDPVETGFPGQPERRARRQFFLPAGETRLAGGS